MDNKYFKVNKNIQIEVNRGPYQGDYKSKVSEINPDNIKILTPYIKEELVPLRVGAGIVVFFTGNNAAYTFNSQVIDREKEKVPVLVIEPPDEINRIQRRDYFRLEVQVELQYRLLDEDGKPVEEDFIESVTLDISAGGIRMVVDEYIQEDTLIEIYMDIPEIKDIPVYGKVVNHYRNNTAKAVGIKFTGISTGLRDEIMSWLFDKQRELRQKGLL